MSKLGAIKVELLPGGEKFQFGGRDCDFNVQQFWQWSTSDLVSNATRGIVAEFIVAKALNIDVTTPRNEWAAFDLETIDPITNDRIKVEVKSSAYLQSWSQQDISKPIFSIKKARAWDRESSVVATDATRGAHVYVFALLAHLDKNTQKPSEDKDTLNPLNLDQWKFYVLPTRVLNERTRSQDSITLSTLKDPKLNAGPIKFDGLRDKVLAAFKNL